MVPTGSSIEWWSEEGGTPTCWNEKSAAQRHEKAPIIIFVLVRTLEKSSVKQAFDDARSLYIEVEISAC